MAWENNFTRDVGARFRDFVGPGVQWQRALWEVGLVLALRELREASDAVQAGALSGKARKWLAESVVSQLGADPGVGDDQQRRRITELLRQDLTAGGVNYYELAIWADDIETMYLDRWANVFDGSDSPSRERAARALASDLLGHRFSAPYLRDWITGLESAPDSIGAAELFSRAAALVKSPLQAFEVMLVFERPPSQRFSRPEQWRDARQTSSWLKTRGYGSVRQHGGLLIEVTARDANMAARQATDIADRLTARAAVGTRSELVTREECFVGGQHEPMRGRVSRRAEVRALEREDALLAVDAPGPVDQALELLSHLNTAPDPVAAAAGWSSVESLLSAPGDEDKVITADRLANLVACSWPRAELTTIAWARTYQAGNDPDPLAEELRGLATNRERSDRILKAVAEEEDLQLTWPAEQMALRRMERLLRAPRAELVAVQRRATATLRRLYRQRNLVLHGGQTAGFNLASALRTAAPLVGAGMDRVTHAALVSGVRPLELAARAQMEIERAGTAQAPSLTSLLE